MTVTYREWKSSSWDQGNADLRLDDRLNGRRVFILLPAYNEEEGLQKLLVRIDRIRRAYAISSDIVIVNDGSADRTRAVVRSFAELPITLIDFPKNRGIAAVFAAGFAWVMANSHDDDFCITLDADNTQSPYVVLDVIRKLLDGYELVIGSRFQSGGGMVGVPLYRRVLSHAVSWILRRMVGLPNVCDYSTFYRGYRVGLIRKGHQAFGDRLMDGQGFSAMAGLLLRLGHLTDRITEVPLRIRYDLKEGRSGLPVLRTVRGYLRLMVQHRRGLFRPGPGLANR